MQLERQLNIQLEKANLGRKIWMDIVERLNLQKQDYVILFPSSDTKINYVALRYLEQFMISKKANSLFIVTSNVQVEKAYGYFTSHIKDCQMISDANMDSLLSFYSLYKFTDQLIIVAFEELPGRTLSNLHAINDISLEELISIGIYQLRKFNRQGLIKYNGNDQDLIEFFRVIEQAN